QQQAPPEPPLQLGGGSSGFGAIEGGYASGTTLRTLGATQSHVNDLGFRSDGLLYGYEGLTANNNSTAGQLLLVDTGTGDATAAGNDSIPDDSGTPPNPTTNASEQ